MNKDLMEEAARLGINVSMYYLLPPNKRDEALRKDIEKQRKEENDGKAAKS